MEGLFGLFGLRQVNYICRLALPARVPTSAPDVQRPQHVCTPAADAEGDKASASLGLINNFRAVSAQSCHSGLCT